MRGIVNDDVVGMIAERTDTKGDQQTEPPITEAQLAHPEGDRGLHYQNRNRDQRSPGVAHHQFANLRMGFDDCSCPARVRLLRFRLVKRDLHGPSKYCIERASSIALFTMCQSR